MNRRDEPTADEEFELVARRAGLTVPEEWRAGTVASYAELMALTALLRTPGRPVEQEPSSVYRIAMEDDDV
ncbi:hypothetical protein [Streptomyces sp. CRN 30]|uniref:hypothetical protein n=1 Tax=Streptomyces sp. CRN 30 TaxID=3075613 RepID=UPI002A811EC6|nr:hypothetical protein [Streptomyces sp. CRN 30]